MRALLPQPELPIEAEEYLAWLSAEKGRSVNTLAAYRRDLRTYWSWLRSREGSLADAVEDDIAAYVEHLRSTGRSPASVARALVAVRGLHRFLADEGVVTSDPTEHVEPPRVPFGLPKALTEDEVLTQAIELGLLGLLHLDDQVGPPGVVGCHRPRSGGGEVAVGDRRPEPRPVLDQDLVAVQDQLAHPIGRDGHTALPRLGLHRHPDDHRPSRCRARHSPMIVLASRISVEAIRPGTSSTPTCTTVMARSSYP